MNKDARITLARLIRQYLAGTLTNFEYDDAASEVAFSCDDDGVWDVFDFFWYFYCDVRRHSARETGWRLSPEAQRAVARCLLFLYSDAPARPPERYWLSCLFGKRFPCRPTMGDPLAADSVWPFASRSDFDAACARPIFLAGHAA